jgi:hypothetical protein
MNSLRSTHPHRSLKPALGTDQERRDGAFVQPSDDFFTARLLVTGWQGPSRR